MIPMTREVGDHGYKGYWSSGTWYLEDKEIQQSLMSDTKELGDQHLSVKSIGNQSHC